MSEKDHRSQQKYEEDVDERQGGILPFPPEKRGEREIQNVLLPLNPPFHWTS
jgi:hypothetical protein